MRAVLLLFSCFFFSNYLSADIVSLEKVTPASARGASDGAINIKVESGGMGPLRFEWSNGSTDEDLKGIPAGNYTLSAKDRFGIEYFLAVTVPVCPVYLDIEAVDSPLLSENQEKKLDLRIDGGNPPFLVEWDTRERKEDISVKANGEYCVRVHDAHCGDYHQCIELNDDKLTASRETASGHLTRVYPNPFSEELIIEIGEEKAGESFTAYLFDESGKPVLYQKHGAGTSRVVFPIKDNISDGNFYMHLIYSDKTREVFPLVRLRELSELRGK